MNFLSISGDGAQDRLLRSFWDSGQDGIKRSRTYTERWQWGSGGVIKGVGAHPGASGYGLVSATANYEPGFATFVWRYETVVMTDDSWAEYGDRGEGSAQIYEGAVGKSPITMHKDIGEWLGYENPETGKRYGRVVGGEVIWEVEDPTVNEGEAGGRSGLNPEGKKINNLNPFYGVTDFYEATALSVQEKMRSKSDLLDIVAGVGTLDVPAGPADTPDDTSTWIYAGASATQVGNKFLVRQSWLMSGYGGWEPALYSRSFFS